MWIFQSAKDCIVIKEIVLRNVSSYSPNVDATMGPLTKINVLYGHNGTGKTTIGNYLQSLSDPRFKACRINPVDAEREVLVYNHTFMEKNFHASSQPGIFTLNEGNIDAEAALKKAEDALKILGEEQQDVVKTGMGYVKAQEDHREALRDRVWALKKPFDNSPLKYCFYQINSKEKLLERVSPLAYTATADTLEMLESEAKELQAASDIELPQISRFTFQESDVESNSIFQECIAGSGDSYLSALIQELGNSDWVKQAFAFVNQADETCPFCQQKLPDDFYLHLKGVFDQTYEKRVAQLNSLAARYEAGVKRLLVQLEKAEYQLGSFAGAAANLQAAIRKNMFSIESKLMSPSTSITLDSTADLIAALNAVVKVEQDKIDAINLKVKDRKSYLDQIKTRFWNCFRGSCDVWIKETAKYVSDFDQKRDQTRQQVEQIRKEAKAHKDVIAQSKASITNIDQSVDSINRWLGVLGLKGFVLVREEGVVPQYRLQRPDQRSEVFKTLSEGEKTLISFLYFLEVCNGELDDKATKLKSERIIVIDDPISSLSHNYIYDVASLIRRQVLTPATRFKQVIILTHNLFFFHEMVKLVKEDRQDKHLALFRATKADYTSVSVMQEKEIQNDYQSFWQTLKDALDGRVSTNVIPIMMRNILEYYFNFVHRQDKLWKALDELSEENPEFRALYRYVNRESHSDAVNLTDFGDIDAGQYVGRFREVFVKTEFEAHFDKMMA